MLREQVPDLGCGAVPVVGQRLDEDSDAFGPVALVRRPSRSRAVGALAGALRDRALDVVLRHRVRARLLDRVLEREVEPGSAPPSFAATMIARESFEKSLPRFASAAPFLCLMVDHLLCPDTRRLLTSSRNRSWTRVSSVSSGWNAATRMRPSRSSTGSPSCSASTSTPGPTSDTRGARMKTPRNGSSSPPSSRSASKLATWRRTRSADLEVGQTEVLAVEQDHPRARAEDRAVERADRLVEPVRAPQARDRRRLAARDDKPVEPVQMLRAADLDDVRAERAKRAGMLANAP